MSKELAKQTSDNRVGHLAADFIKVIHSAWGVKKIKRTVTVPTEGGGAAIVEKEVKVPSAIARLNVGRDVSEFYEYGAKLSDEDFDRVTALIKAGTFELVKGIQANDARDLVLNPRFSPSTWEAAAAADSASLATLVKYKGETKAAALLHLLIARFVKKFGKRNDLTDSDVSHLAEGIVAESDYRRLTVADIIFILKTGLRGKKGNRFNVDAQTIEDLLAEGYEEKITDAGRRAENEHLQEVGIEKETRFIERRIDPETAKLVAESMIKNAAEQTKLNGQE